MMQRVLCVVLLVFAVSCGARLVAIGDVHGDLAQFKAILQLAELTSKDNHWIGGNATVVQVGDLLDRGPDDVMVLLYSKELQEEAKAAGGEVIFLVGNHEIMNLQGAFHYVHPKSMESTGSRAERKARFASSGDLGSFIRTFSLVHSDLGTVFVHAGLSADYAQSGLAGLNTITQTAMDADDWKNSVFSATGPVWTRTLINEASHGRCEKVADALKVLGLQRMVVGHTPQRAGNLETYCDDSLIAIDVGMSKHMYGHLAALELTTNEAGEVEMREISGKYVKPDSESGPAKDEGKGLEDALRNQHILQEIMETVEETNKQKKEVEKEEDL